MGAPTSEAALRDSEEAARRAFIALSVSLSSGQEPPEAYTVPLGRWVYRVEVEQHIPMPGVTEYRLGAVSLASVGTA